MVKALFNKKTKSQREKLTKELASNDFLSPNDPHFWHGRIFSNNDSLMIPPTVTWESPDQPRDDHINHDSGDWLTASEYTDTEEMMNIKIEKLAELLKNSKKTVVYSGAGISVSAGIGQAARGSQPNRKKHPIFGVKPTTCKPTITHFALGALASEHDLIHGWVQQNHDGLPQKAGFPQDRINEIHGSWYDPSNPVVVYSGSLRTHEFTWMEHEAETADLVLVLGTSLSGLNADQVPIKAAHRSLDTTTKNHGGALGMVIINLQQTPHDGKASLRIFGSSDDVMRKLLFHHLHHLRIPTRMAPKTFSFPSKKEFLVPYNANGELNTSASASSSSRSSANKKKSSTSPAGGGKMMIWNLEIGAKVRIVHHNVKGAGQPSHKAILAQNPQMIGRVLAWDDSTMAIQISITTTTTTTTGTTNAAGAVTFLLGYWWIDTAMYGRTPTIPIVNTSPEFVS